MRRVSRGALAAETANARRGALALVHRKDTMTLQFEGTAHPPPQATRGNVADLSAAEIATTNMGRVPGGGTELLVEHDRATRVGTVHASWESPVDGSLRVIGVVNDPDTAAAVRSGSLRGLSLGTGVTQHVGGQTLLRTQEELSLCAEPRRAGCWIDQLNGQTVRRTACFSVAKGTGACAPSAPSAHAAHCTPP